VRHSLILSFSSYSLCNCLFNSSFSLCTLFALSFSSYSLCNCLFKSSFSLCNCLFNSFSSYSIASLSSFSCNCLFKSSITLFALSFSSCSIFNCLNNSSICGPESPSRFLFSPSCIAICRNFHWSLAFEYLEGVFSVRFSSPPHSISHKDEFPRDDRRGRETSGTGGEL
jgi:hypothetical protein